MDESSATGLVVFMIVLSLIIGWVVVREKKEEIAQLKTEIYLLENRVEDYQFSLSEANDRISDANSQIEDAQNYAWLSYDEMGEALENLETISEVGEP